MRNYDSWQWIDEYEEDTYLFYDFYKKNIH